MTRSAASGSQFACENEPMKANPGLYRFQIFLKNKGRLTRRNCALRILTKFRTLALFGVQSDP